MASHERRWPLGQAERVGQEMARLLNESCERLAVAGSVRRRKPDVGDIELVCIGRRIVDLWGNPMPGSRLDDQLLALIRRGTLGYHLDARGHKSFGALNKRLVHAASGIPVDIFSATAQNWGMALMVRTGPAEFVKKAMARFRELGMRGHAYGGVEVDGKQASCPSEEEVFRLLGWPCVPPEKRALWR